jgi:hypothetical protein
MRIPWHESSTQMVIKDWAINMTKNKPIFTGQTMRMRQKKKVSPVNS